jgi:hypothetical protein
MVLARMTLARATFDRVTPDRILIENDTCPHWTLARAIIFLVIVTLARVYVIWYNLPIVWSWLIYYWLVKCLRVRPGWSTCSTPFW